jgi:peroxiredoxin
MLAMERLGRKPADIQAWMAQHANDPACALLAELAVTGSQRLVGRAAPALKARRRDGQAGELDLATFAGGKPCLVLFVATWSPVSEALLPQVQPAADKAGVRVLAVSLDNKDTIDRIPAWVQRLNLTCPVVGDGVGWDGELDDAWQVDQLPAAILVGADGVVMAVDLAQGRADGFADRLTAVLAPRAGGPATGAPAGPALAPGPRTDDAIIP